MESVKGHEGIFARLRMLLRKSLFDRLAFSTKSIIRCLDIIQNKDFIKMKPCETRVFFCFLCAAVAQMFATNILRSSKYDSTWLSRLPRFGTFDFELLLIVVGPPFKFILAHAF